MSGDVGREASSALAVGSAIGLGAPGAPLSPNSAATSGTNARTACAIVTAVPPPGNKPIIAAATEDTIVITVWPEPAVGVPFIAATTAVSAVSICCKIPLADGGSNGFNAANAFAKSVSSALIVAVSKFPLAVQAERTNPVVQNNIFLLSFSVIPSVKLVWS